MLFKRKENQTKQNKDEQTITGDKNKNENKNKNKYKIESTRNEMKSLMWKNLPQSISFALTLSHSLVLDGIIENRQTVRPVHMSNTIQ